MPTKANTNNLLPVPTIGQEFEEVETVNGIEHRSRVLKFEEVCSDGDLLFYDHDGLSIYMSRNSWCRVRSWELYPGVVLTQVTEPLA